MIEEFAKKHDLDETGLRLMLKGIEERVRHAVSNGAVITEELITAAATHWWECQDEYYNDLITNKNGARDQLTDTVYNLLRSKKNV